MPVILYLMEEAITHPHPHPILEFRDGIGLMQVSSHGRLTAVHCSPSSPEQKCPFPLILKLCPGMFIAESLMRSYSRIYSRL